MKQEMLSRVLRIREELLGAAQERWGRAPEIIAVSKTVDAAAVNEVLDAGITRIGEYTFYYCTSLTSITIPNGVTSIGSNAFAFCEDLIEVTISDGVTSIEDYAFSACHSLTTVTVPASVTSISYNAFNECIGVGSFITSEGSYAQQWAKENGYKDKIVIK